MSRSLPTLLLRGGGGCNVYFQKDVSCYNGIFLNLFVGLSSCFHCCIVKGCFMWFVIMCVYYTVPFVTFVTSLVWRFQSCVAKDHWCTYSSCQFARHLRITPRRNTITREQPPSLRDPHKEISQPINPRSFNLLKIVNRLVCVYFIYRANCLYKENYTYNGHCWSLNKDFLLWITVKICYDNTGNMPYTIRAEISAHKHLGKCIYLLFVWLAVIGFRQNYFRSIYCIILEILGQKSHFFTI